MISMLIRSCDYCSAKSQCIAYWQNLQSQFDSFITEMDSKQVCTRLGFCNVSTLCARMGIFQQACEETLSAFIQGHQQPIEQHLPHTSVVVLPSKSDEHEEGNLFDDSNSTCILCEYMMNILVRYIHQQSTQEEIEQSLERICREMPITLQKQCHELVDNYGPPIIATLIRQFDVSTICRKLNLCTKEMEVDLSHLTRANLASCGICDYVSTYVHFALERDSSEASLQHALSTVCTHLSHEQQSQCQTLVQLFGPHIRKLQLDLGKSFCTQLPICRTPMSELKPAIHVNEIVSENNPTIQNADQLKDRIMKNLDNTPECTLCQYIVSYLDAVLKTNKSEAAVEAALERVCTILPSE